MNKSETSIPKIYKIQSLHKMFYNGQIWSEMYIKCKKFCLLIVLCMNFPLYFLPNFIIAGYFHNPYNQLIYEKLILRLSNTYRFQVLNEFAIIRLVWESKMSKFSKVKDTNLLVILINIIMNIIEQYYMNFINQMKYFKP